MNLSNRTLAKIVDEPDEFIRLLIEYVGTDGTETLVQRFYAEWEKQGCHK